MWVKTEYKSCFSPIKSILILLAFTSNSYLFSQNKIEIVLAEQIHDLVITENIYDLALSDKISESRMGLWKVGDYKIYIALDTIELKYRTIYSKYLELANYYSKLDTNCKTCSPIILQGIKASSERYLVAANLLKKAKHGFNLRKLVVYYGENNKEENKGNSKLVEDYVKHLVEQGNAIVLYKEKRIYKLHKLVEDYGERLDYMELICIYYNNKKKYLFRDYLLKDALIYCSD